MKKIIFIIAGGILLLAGWRIFLELPQFPRESRPAVSFSASVGQPAEKTPEKIVPTVTPALAAVEKSVLLDVPFVVQAPRHNWKDPVYQNACEEAAILMAMRWVQGKTLTKEDAFVEIQKISDFSKTKYGFYLDQAAEDVVMLMRDYFGFSGVSFRENIKSTDIKAELSLGHLVLAPVNGQKLGNPYYTPPGPAEHMIVIKGFDVATGEFITNDPGVGKGEGFRYKEKVLDGALRRYPSGHKEQNNIIEKVMIVVEK